MIHTKYITIKYTPRVGKSLIRIFMKASTSFGFIRDKCFGIITFLGTQSLIMVYEVIIHKNPPLVSGLTIEKEAIDINLTIFFYVTLHNI